jgi:hypothetical protein
MTTALVSVSYITPSASLTAAQFDTLAEFPPNSDGLPTLPRQTTSRPTGKILKTFRPLPACIGPNSSLT